MFGDFGTSIFSTAPTRATAAPASAMGPVGGAAQGYTTSNANNLFAGSGGAFNVSAPFQTPATAHQDPSLPAQDALFRQKMSTQPAQEFQVNQISTQTTTRQGETPFIFNGGTATPSSPATTMQSPSAYPSPVPPQHASALQDGFLANYGAPRGGSLPTGFQTPQAPMPHRVESGLFDHQHHVPVPGFQGIGEPFSEQGRRSRPLRDGTPQSVSMSMDDHRFQRGGAVSKRESELDLQGQAMMQGGAGSGLPGATRKPRTAGLSRELVKRQTTKQEAQELLTRTVHMRCLPPNITQAQLAQFLHESGPFDRVRVCSNGRANQKWVYGFVEFTHTRAAEALLARSGFQMGADADGKPLWIKCIRAAQPIQDLLPSDAEPTRNRLCRFGADERAQQTIAALAATPAGALWEQAKATMSPGAAAITERRASDDVTSSSDERWEPSDHSLHSPHVSKDDLSALQHTNMAAGWLPAEHVVRGGASGSAGLAAQRQPDAWQAAAGPIRRSIEAVVTPGGPVEESMTVLPTIWAMHRRLCDPATPLCDGAVEAMKHVQRELCVALQQSAAHAGHQDPSSLTSTLEVWASLQAFLTAHELVLLTVAFDAGEMTLAVGGRGSRRGLTLFVCRFLSYFSAALVALSRLEHHKDAFRVAVRDLLACFTLFFPTPTSSLGKPCQSNGGRRGRGIGASIVADVFLWCLNLLGVVLSLSRHESATTESDCLATILAAYITASRAETTLFPELGSDIYSLKEEQLANMLTHTVMKRGADRTVAEVFTALLSAGCVENGEVLSVSEVVASLPVGLRVL